ncbi:MAG: phosphoenolpyruvate synthase [Patescibacteria group bacterium]|jgi:pyruvate,water dikinase
MTQKKAERLTISFRELAIEDVPYVGGKNAALGELYAALVPKGVKVPDGFAITAHAYQYFVRHNSIDRRITEILKGLDTRRVVDLQHRGKQVRDLFLKTSFPEDLEKEIIAGYQELERRFGKRIDVAIRSSATAEDLPGASFAGQQETFLNMQGTAAVLDATRRCFASLFTDRAISYRADKGFSHTKIALSVGVQIMVRSDLAASGVAFTIHTETGFDKVVSITGSYGLGEMVVQGKVTPDEFTVFKPTLAAGKQAIISRTLGSKKVKMIYAKTGIKQVNVAPADRQKYCLTDREVLQLGRWCVEIEKYFSKKRGHYQPMDIEWAKDGKNGKLYIVQARPETVHAMADASVQITYTLKRKGKVLVNGIAVGSKVAVGKVRAIKSAKQMSTFQKGEVLVTGITDPDWEPIMKIASAIVTDKGGRTSHAAIVSRELGIPCIVGTNNATAVLKNGMPVTIDCSSGESGIVYAGELPFSVSKRSLKQIPKTKTKVMMILASPDGAFQYHASPAEGVGLGRLEFIIAAHVKVHPNALIEYTKLKREAKKDVKARRLVSEIDALTVGYTKKSKYYVDKLSEGIAKIGATFWPHEVIIRFSDFKTNEYRTLLGGERYEPIEENPMLGWRGASRYYDPKFAEAFGLECEALIRVRNEMGLTNVLPMVPFCRTPEEGKKVIAVMAKHGLSKTTDRKLRIYVMCEIPSNVIQADAFLDIFDGMSIGSNDLTQLTLGLDRDSGIVAHVGNEKSPALQEMVVRAIQACLRRKKYIGICGQAPSDYPEFGKFLVDQGIESISLNPDAVLDMTIVIAEHEKKNRSLLRRKRRR